MTSTDNSTRAKWRLWRTVSSGLKMISMIARSPFELLTNCCAPYRSDIPSSLRCRLRLVFAAVRVTPVANDLEPANHLTDREEANSLSSYNTDSDHSTGVHVS